MKMQASEYSIKLHLRVHVISVLFSLISTLICSAQNYPINVFIAPMDTPLLLSAPFGSLRDNHFHSGMDIRTGEKEGLPVYAIDDGYVVRIKVSAIGYGKAVYLNHKNGYTSVYGHLQKFNGALANYVKKHQYQIQQFEFDHFPTEGAIPVKKGDIIGFSGNSGTSSGPHLHFEIRDTKTEEPINPQLFGIMGVDSLAPFINRMVVYDLSLNRPMLLSSRRISTNNLLPTDSGWLCTDTFNVAATKLGIGVETYDYLVNRTKEYSIYCADLLVDRKKIFSYKLERINFADTKFINTHIDYETYKNFGYRINKCFLDDGNEINIYPFMCNKGIINLPVGHTKSIKVEVGDVNGRTYTLHAWLHSTDTSTNKETPCTNQVWYPQKNNTYAIPGLLVNIPKAALYDTVYPCLQVSSNRINGTLSPSFQVHLPTTPLHKSISVSIKPDTLLRPEKMILAQVNGTTIKPMGGTFNNGYVTLTTATFGAYTIIIDSVSPTIKATNLTKNGMVSDSSKLTFKISDSQSGIDQYKGFINNNWVLLEYDPKNDELIYWTDEQTLKKVKQEFRLIVIDKKGNSSEFKQNIQFN